MLSVNESNIVRIDKNTPALPYKAEAIASLAREIWREHYTALIGAAQVEYMLDLFQSAERIQTDILTDCYVYFIAERADCANGHETVGYCAVRPKEDYLLLSKLYVRKEYRGKGIARRFLDEAAKPCLREFRIDKIRLTVNKYNTGSIAAYKKMGFRTIDLVVTDIGDGYVMDDYIMELRAFDPMAPTA